MIRRSDQESGDGAVFVNNGGLRDGRVTEQSGLDFLGIKHQAMMKDEPVTTA